MVRFERTISLLRKLTRDFFFFFKLRHRGRSFFFGGGVILTENAPKRRILCIREKPEVGPASSERTGPNLK